MDAVVQQATQGQRVVKTSGEADVAIRLERLERDQWSLRYTLTQPVERLDFGKPIGDLRGHAWRPEAGFELFEEEGREQLRRFDGALFQEATLALSTYDQLVPKQYVPFNTFSDGGVSVYTGFLTTDALVGDRSLDLQPTFTFVPRAGDAVIVAGQRSEAAMTWEAQPQPHAFVYFGAAQAIESETLIAVVDPSTPEWAKARFAAFLPRVFAYLQQRFQRRLQRRPLVLVSARFDDGNRGYSIKGGALSEQIQVRLRGLQILEADSGLDDYLFKFIAHEGAHLWQANRAFDNSLAWTYEGAADAIALRAVVDLGVWSEAKAQGEREQAVDQCGKRLQEESLTVASASDLGAFDLSYSCGLVVALASEALLQRVDPEADLFTFWAYLARTLGSLEGEANAETYYGALTELGVDPEAIQPLRDFVEGRYQDVVVAVRALLDGPPLETSPAARSSQTP